MKRFLGRLWDGLQMSKGWFWILLNACLSIFTIATVIFVVLELPSGTFRAGSVLMVVALVILVVLLFIQAPYRGQVKETERVQTLLDNEREEHKRTQEDMTPLLRLRVQQLIDRGNYIWAVLRPVNLRAIAQQDFVTVHVDLISCLVESVTVNRVMAELSVGPITLPWFEFMSAHRVLEVGRAWSGAERVPLTDSNLRSLRAAADASAVIQLNMRLELTDGGAIHIPAIEQSIPRNGG